MVVAVVVIVVVVVVVVLFVVLCFTCLFINCLHFTLFYLKVIGKFSIRLVPDQDPEVIGQLVIDHLNYVHRQRGSPNIMTYVQKGVDED